MTKQELLKRIELLEARIIALESRQITVIPMPAYPQPSYPPWGPWGPYIGTPIISGETTSGSIGPPQVLPFN